ncbi:MAG: serine hydrolase domain-containing protein [Ignavibacteriaceae bacterium]
MKSILNFRIFIVIILFSNTILSQTKLPHKVELEIETLFNKFVDNNSPGYAVGIFIDTTLTFAKGFGNANLEYNIKITPETTFNLASLSKQYTAACLALLILEKKVRLEDNVKKYIPEFPDYNYEVKIKHLVYMTSGIPEYYDMSRGNGLNWNPYLYFTIDTAIQASLKNKKLEYEPGTKWSYSNINYMLLTKIIEKISGQTFSEFAKEHLFEPLGMKHTIVNDDITEIIPNRATGYVERSTKNLEAFGKAGMKLKNYSGLIQVHRNSPHYGGSGVYSTINDLYLWDKNMYTHKFGGEEFYKLMHKRMKFKHPKDNDAFGLVYGEYNSVETIWYSGSDLGFSTYFISFPKQKFTVICLSNLDDGNAESYAMKIIDILVNDGVIKIK